MAGPPQCLVAVGSMERRFPSETVGEFTQSRGLSIYTSKGLQWAPDLDHGLELALTVLVY